MTTDVNICNLTLSHLVQKADVTSISPPDGTTFSEKCAQFFPTARDKCLAKNDWSFARKRQTLNQVTLSTMPASWEYAYQKPGDMIKNRFLIPTDGSDDDKADYKIEGQYIYTNSSTAILVYTRKLTDMGQVSIDFELACSMLLASYLAGHVKGGDAKLREYWYQQFLLQAGEAASMDNDTGDETWVHEPEVVTDR